MSTKIKNGEKILFIGDSITDCGRLEENTPLGNGYVKMFSDIMTVREPEKEIQIVNRGISGQTISELKERWHDDVLNNSPDWLSIKIGINDVHRFLMEDAYSFLNLDKFEEIYEELLAITIEKLPACKLILIDPFYISNDSFDDSFRTKILTLLPEYIAVVHKLSEKYKTVHVKTHELFQTQLKHQLTEKYCDEPVHPNSAGHFLIAEAVYRELAVHKNSKMNGILELEVLLKNMNPVISENEYVFCAVNELSFKTASKLNPICIFKEDEGLTLVLEKACAESEKLHFDEVFKKITLHVHSSLKAVGLTAAVSTALADNGISANIIAAYYHDHIFVPNNKSALAVEVLLSLSHDS